jgi:hypothetical protein
LVRLRVLAFRIRSEGSDEGGTTLIAFPPMQGGASFNMSAVKAEIDKAIAERAINK